MRHGAEGGKVMYFIQAGNDSRDMEDECSVCRI